LQEKAVSVSLEGLSGASKSKFVVDLYKFTRRPIVVLTKDQNTGESLLGDLQFFAKHNRLKIVPQLFPSWEILPYENLSPLSEVTGERLAILSKMVHGDCHLLIVPVEAAMQYLMPRSVLKNLTYYVNKGEQVDREILEACISDNGFTRTNIVEERGQFSPRGDILDIFLPANENPLRLEFFGDEIESIRFFDVNSQISIDSVDRIEILPLREFFPGISGLDQGIKNIMRFGDLNNIKSGKVDELVEKLKTVECFPGVEWLSPFFIPARECIFDYLREDTVIVFDEKDVIDAKFRDYRELVMEEYHSSIQSGEIASSPNDLFLDQKVFSGALKAKSFLSLNSLKMADDNDFSVIHFNVNQPEALPGRFDAFVEKARLWLREGYKAIIVAPTKGHVKRVNQLLLDKDLSLEVKLGFINSGFQLPDTKEIFIAEHELFGRTHKHRLRRRLKSNAFQRGFKDLKSGDMLVHIDYGIGKYIGTKEITTGVGGGEFMEIHYADDEKLYIPMDGLGCIQKYIGSGDSEPPLSKLGGVGWKRQKKKIEKAVKEMAGELSKIYAAREMAQGHAFSSHPVMAQEFADSFEFIETDDQLKAIEDVLQDMENEKPMDRLICGDVGYGKTEVAMRAAFKAVLDHKQVAVLVPTTILAQQHLNTFRERLHAYPVNIEVLSRFRSAREQKDVLENLRKGNLDIIIGTHRLLSNDVKFADLGLIVIDEEQRFGVKHKEKFKTLRAQVDIVTLTATPIPRTLHFSLMGVRDLSVIESPPVDRLAIKTFVRKFDEKLIREAVLRELDRGGQVYFVHNKVKSIHSVAALIQNIVGPARIDIAHGQMPEKRLENVMMKFIDKEIDILVCTSIIESGLDIPSANTIIINRADQFGLAQLYQLRGRVGRYKHQAYAYFLIPGLEVLTDDARKRLSAIEELSGLSAGFQLAARDMEIRGTGNMLGKEQSGHIAMIGFDLYCQMVEESIKVLKGEKVSRKIEPEIDLQIKGFIPKEYISDLNQRLEFYRRFQLLSEFSEYNEIAGEMNDRYGDLPEPVEKLLALLKIRSLCQQLHISKIRLIRNEMLCRFETTTPLSSKEITGALQEGIRFISEYEIGIKAVQNNWRADCKILERYFKKLTTASDE